MLTHLYNQLLIASFAASLLYLILKLFSKWTQRYFKASWHYVSYVLVCTFFLIPYQKLLPWLNLKTTEEIRNSGFEIISAVDILSPLSSWSTDSPNLQINDQESGFSLIAQVIHFMPYFLVMGTMAFLCTYWIQNHKLNRSIFKLCERVEDESIIKEIEYCRLRLNIKKAIPVYISPDLTTPFLHGVFHPKIILPCSDFTLEEYRYIFMHELIHYKRRDLWLKWMLLFIQAIHWFNPFIYLAIRDIEQFCELSCDEKMVKSMDIKERRRYCYLLLNILWKDVDQKVKLYSAFSEKKNLERRINMILNQDGIKNKKSVRFIATTLIVALVSFGAVMVASASEGYKQVDSNEAVIGGEVGVSQKSTLIAPAQGMLPAQAEVAPTSEVGILGVTPFATVYWSNEEIGYNTEMRFISSYTGGYFIIRKNIQATFSFSIKGGSSENVRVAWKDKNGNTTVLFEGSTSSKTVTYTPDKDVEGNFYIWNKSAAAITISEASLSY